MTQNKQTLHVCPCWPENRPFKNITCFFRNNAFGFTECCLMNRPLTNCFPLLQHNILFILCTHCTLPSFFLPLYQLSVLFTITLHLPFIFFPLIYHLHNFILGPLRHHSLSFLNMDQILHQI